MNQLLPKIALVKNHIFLLLTCCSFAFVAETQAQDEWSVAREWNEEILFAITKDFPRPTVHARNLFHSSALMYDCWAAYDPSHDPWLLGRTRGSYFCAFDGVSIPSDPEELRAAREETISFAMYRLMSHRFLSSPGFFEVQTRMNNLMAEKGYDPFDTLTDYVIGGPSALGNYIAQEMINFGFTDGSNEINGYANQQYVAQNDTIFPEQPGNPSIIDPNLWQLISLTNQVNQAGEPIFTSPPFLSPEWGNVVPFAMTGDDMETLERDGFDWNVYMDPGAPPLLDPDVHSEWDDLYKWGFMMVPIWQSHLDPDDDVIWDISPASIGNIGGAYPAAFTVDEYSSFYNLTEGGEIGQGHPVNPKTGLPYEPQMVSRADYARVLAEFWADGPQSYTPPGHWYEIVNHAVLDHPDFERKWMGEGDELDPLEWDVKMYLTIGGAMHDAAVSAWSIKGYYDYVRPISAVRYLCDMGQSSDTTLSNYNPAGTPLLPGFIEVVEEGDPLAGQFNQHVGKIKLFTWKGPDYINYEGPNATQPTNYSGVGWILGENWWPYQRPTFVSPPFAGYISGHSTYSSTAAEVMERITGDAFFPGGVGEFEAVQDTFLHFEIGPSQSITLQWATYRDASDQTSLSRIWGGIHPPQDDIPGRYIGMELGEKGVDVANSLFGADRPVVVNVASDQPFYNIDDIGNTMTLSIAFDRDMNTAVAPMLEYMEDDITLNSATFLAGSWINDQVYEVTYELLDGAEKLGNIQLSISNAEDVDGKLQNVYLSAKPFVVDTDRPDIADLTFNETLLNDQIAVESTLMITIEVDEESDMTSQPVVSFVSAEDLSGTLFFVSESSEWLDEFHYLAVFTVLDNDEEIDNIGVSVSGVKDVAGNDQNAHESLNLFSIDTRNPELYEVLVNDSVFTVLNIQDIGNSALVVEIEFDEDMNTLLTPTFSFPNDNPMGISLTMNIPGSMWLDSLTYRMVFNLSSTPNEMFDIDVVLNNFNDLAGNNPATVLLSDLFIIDTQRPEIISLASSSVVISDSEVGINGFQAILDYNEPMDTSQNPVLVVSADVAITGSIFYNPFGSQWLDEFTYEASFDITDQNIEVEDINLQISFGKDAAGNFHNPYEQENWINLDTRNPEIVVLAANTYTIGNSHIGDEGFNLLAVFDESMSPDDLPQFEFAGPVEVSNMLSVNNSASSWLNSTTYQVVYDVANQELVANDIDVLLSAARDLAGNEVVGINFSDYFNINTTSVGIAENNGLGITFFPNPVNGNSNLRIESGVSLNRAIVSIISVSGQVHFQQEYNRIESGIFELPLNGMASGFYLVQLQSEEGSQVHKMIVLD